MSENVIGIDDEVYARNNPDDDEGTRDKASDPCFRLQQRTLEIEIQELGNPRHHRYGR